jgi:hypothetical protein
MVEHTITLYDVAKTEEQITIYVNYLWNKLLQFVNICVCVSTVESGFHAISCGLEN